MWSNLKLRRLINGCLSLLNLSDYGSKCIWVHRYVYDISVSHFEWEMTLRKPLTQIAPTGLDGFWVQRSNIYHYVLITWLINHASQLHQNLTESILAQLAGREKNRHTLYSYIYVCVCVSELKWESDKLEHALSAVPSHEPPPSHSVHLTHIPGTSQLGYCQSSGVIPHN